jgi:hypothetical protein
MQWKVEMNFRRERNGWDIEIYAEGNMQFIILILNYYIYVASDIWG